MSSGTLTVAHIDQIAEQGGSSSVGAAQITKEGSTERQSMIAALALSTPRHGVTWDLGTLDPGETRMDIETIRTISQHLKIILGHYAPWIEVNVIPSVREIAKSCPAILEALLELPLRPAEKPPHGNAGWDSLVDPWVDTIPEIGEKIPAAYRIWQSANRYLKAGDSRRARRCEELNYLLHNSYIPARADFRGEITFGYGGIGVIIHPDSDIFRGVTIGANVTIGSSGSHVRQDERNGKPTTAPQLRDYAVVGAGSNISGGLTIGALSIIAPNSVVTRDIGPGEIVAGAPARKIGQVGVENALRYRVKYLPLRNADDETYSSIAQQHLS